MGDLARAAEKICNLRCSISDVARLKRLAYDTDAEVSLLRKDVERLREKSGRVEAENAGLKEDCRRFVAENYRMRNVLIDYHDALEQDIEDTPPGDDTRPAMEEELAEIREALRPEPTYQLGTGEITPEGRG